MPGDTIFGINVRPFGGRAVSDARFIGVQESVQCEWRLNAHSNITETISHFQRGTHLREVGAKSVTYLGVLWTYRF